jgi:hypothetical protein
MKHAKKPFTMDNPKVGFNMLQIWFKNQFFWFFVKPLHGHKKFFYFEDGHKASCFVTIGLIACHNYTIAT